MDTTLEKLNYFVPWLSFPTEVPRSEVAFLRPYGLA